LRNGPELDPPTGPNGHDQNFYIVVNNYGKLGPAFAEADLETTITDLMSGQYGDCVVAFNTSALVACNVRRQLPRAVN
jgi:hypothetical protein